jgi:hypothetical protein
MARIALEYRFATWADLREKGAMPPVVWQPRHFSAKIGATAAQVGAAVRVAGPVLREPAAIAAIPTAPPRATARATTIRLLRTMQS